MDLRIATLCFMLGIAAAIYLAVVPPILLTLCFFLLLPWAWRYRTLRPVICVIFGFLYCVIRANNQLPTLLPKDLEAEWISVRGMIASIPVQRAHGTQFHFSLKEIVGYETLPFDGAKLALTWAEPAIVLEPGQSWQLTVRLKRPHGYQNPGGLDSEFYSFRQSIVGKGYVKTGDHQAHNKAPVSLFLLRIRFLIQQHLLKVLGPGTGSALISALLIGDRSLIHSSQWQVLQNTGTAHLMAISGLHIGLAYGLGLGLAMALLRLLPAHRLNRHSRIAAHLFALSIAVGYALMAGFSLPTQRALVMSVVFAVAQLRYQQSRYSTTLAISIFAVLLFDPLSLWSPGLWLSFLAVGIILFTMVYRVGHKPWYWHWGRAQCALSLFSMPLVWYVFSNVSFTSIFANLVAIPIMSFIIVPLMFATLIITLFHSEFAVFLWMLNERCLLLLWQYLNSLSRWHLPVEDLPSTSLMSLLCCLLGLLWILAPRGLPGKSMAVLLWLPFLFGRETPLSEGEFRLNILDVGQGLSIVVHTRDHHLLYDTGPSFSPNFDLGRVVVAPYLRQQNIDYLDRIVISHTDNDHIGGLRSVLDVVTTGELLISHAGEKKDLPEHQLCVAQTWRWDGVRFEIMYPDADTELNHLSRNDRSCVLRISNRHYAVLIPGDITRKVERQLARRYGDAMHSDLLVVPHHGSKTSSSNVFLAAVAPEIAVFSSGYRNRFGFPKQAIMQRYIRRRIQTLNTATAGAITVHSSRDELRVDSYRQTQRRLWHTIYDNDESGEN